MLVGAVYLSSIVAVAVTTPSGNALVWIVALVGGVVAWRWKRGDFYKSVAQEKTDEVDRLRDERDRLAQLTDITPIVTTLEKVTAALDRHATLTEQVFSKVADMNGSLRAHGEAMKALADHLIVEESARALLQAASTDRKDMT